MYCINRTYIQRPTSNKQQQARSNGEDKDVCDGWAVQDFEDGCEGECQAEEGDGGHDGR